MQDADIIPAEIIFDELDDAACKRALAILVAVGTDLVLECRTPGPDATLAERTKSYEHASLAVRRAILLYQHLKLDLVSPAARDTQARKAIIRQVEDTIERHAGPADAAALRVELVERLESPDFAADLAHRTPGDLIRDLCNDLGLTSIGSPRHRRRTPDDIAILCAQAAAPPNSLAREVRLESPLPLAGEGWVRVGPPSQTSPPRSPH